MKRVRLTLSGLGAWARPTWGRGACFARWALDVGLDSSVPSHQGKGHNICPRAQEIADRVRDDSMGQECSIEEKK